eukprot:scaffold3219_cov105-Isochrysis_galbana.AAC.2
MVLRRLLRRVGHEHMCRRVVHDERERAATSAVGATSLSGARRGGLAGRGRSRRGGTFEPVPLQHVTTRPRHLESAKLGDETLGLVARATSEVVLVEVDFHLTQHAPRRGRTRRAQFESACQRVRRRGAAPREARTRSDWVRGSRRKVRVELAHEVGKRGPPLGTIFGPLLPGKKVGEEVERGVGVRALTEKVAQSGHELPPRADDVWPARDETDQLLA